MKTIELTNGGFALVDDEDYERVSEYKWCRAGVKTGVGYAYSTGKIKETGKRMMMHVFILGKVEGFITDHADGNRLNNQRSNLRFATVQQNARNKKAVLDKKCKGVSYRYGKYYVRICIDGKQKHVGVYDSEEEAANAYDEAALKYFGEFARTNS